VWHATARTRRTDGAGYPTHDGCAVGCEHAATPTVSGRHAGPTRVTDASSRKSRPASVSLDRGSVAAETSRSGAPSASSAKFRRGSVPVHAQKSAGSRCTSRELEAYAGSSTAWIVSRRPKRGRNPSSAPARLPSTMQT